MGKQQYSCDHRCSLTQSRPWLCVGTLCRWPHCSRNYFPLPTAEDQPGAFLLSVLQPLPSVHLTDAGFWQLHRFPAQRFSVEDRVGNHFYHSYVFKFKETPYKQHCFCEYSPIFSSKNRQFYTNSTLPH